MSIFCVLVKDTISLPQPDGGNMTFEGFMDREPVKEFFAKLVNIHAVEYAEKTPEYIGLMDDQDSNDKYQATVKVIQKGKVPLKDNQKCKLLVCEIA